MSKNVGTGSSQRPRGIARVPPQMEQQCATRTGLIKPRDEASRARHPDRGGHVGCCAVRSIFGGHAPSLPEPSREG